jgi:hypothetical protein
MICVIFLVNVYRYCGGLTVEIPIVHFPKTSQWIWRHVGSRSRSDSGVALVNQGEERRH